MKDSCENGHYIDSQRMGLTYLIDVGVPSLSTANSSTHKEDWYEMNANKNAERYFRKHYGVDWDAPYNRSTIRDYYPTRKK